MTIEISQKILRKIEKKHSVTREDVEQCFANRSGKYLKDTREEHRSNPPTLWFISETDYGRKLKVVFIFSNNIIYLRSAFEPNDTEMSIYNKHG
jgi:uncharacterized DUF497 family protein